MEYCVHNPTTALNNQNITINIAIIHVEKLFISFPPFLKIFSTKMGDVENYSTPKKHFSLHLQN